MCVLLIYKQQLHICVYSYPTYNSCTYVCTLTLQTTAAHMCLLLPYKQQLHICVYSAHLCVLLPCTTAAQELHICVYSYLHICVYSYLHICVYSYLHI
jgi:hypothetical protein